MPTEPLRGFRDFYPEEFALRDYIFRTWRRVATRYGFEEYDGPPLEALELYTQKSGEEIVGQLYAFTDKGDRQVALRPEMTPSLARMVSARANGLKKPIRWFSIPQLFRYERQQRGRLREHFQLNCDLIGDSSALADAEIIALSIDVMRAFGLTHEQVKVRLSDRRVITALLTNAGVAEAQLPEVLQVMDRWYKVTDTAVTEMLQKVGLGAAAVSNVRELADLDRLVDVERRIGDRTTELKSFAGVLAALDGMGLGDFVKIDLTIVRGLDYYTGTVFELFDAGRTLRAICGGGRYDGLTNAIGGVELGAVGFGMGDVVLGELLKEKGLVPAHGSSIDVFLAAVTEDDVPALLRLAHELRDAGLRAEYSLGHQAVGKQLKLADARSARFAVVIGPDDREKDQVVLKDLVAKGQMPVGRSEIAVELQKRLMAGER